MNEVIRSLGRHRSRRNMSKHARTLQKACKRIRNDPFFRGWRFAFVDLDSTHGGLTEECILGIIACPSWADCGSERLVIVARHTDGRDLGRRRRPARVEYAIKNVVLSPPGSLHTDRGGNEDTYPPYIEPISLAAAFRETAYEWEAELVRKMTHLSSMRTDQGRADDLIEKVHASETVIVQSARELPQGASQSMPDSASIQEQVSSPVDSPEHSFAAMQPIRISIPGATVIDQYESGISEALKDAQFLGRIEMPEEESETLLRIIAYQLEAARSPRACAYSLAQDYPVAVAYALVRVAAEEYAEGEVWPRIAKRLGGLETDIARALASSIEKCQSRYSLADCGLAKKLRYVTPLLFQGGVPDSCIPELIEIVWRNCVQRGIVTPRAVLQWFRYETQGGRWREKQYRISEPVLDFLECGGAWAEHWVVATAVFLGSQSGLPDDARNTAPSRLMGALEKWEGDQTAATLEIVESERGHGGEHDRFDDSPAGADRRAPMRARVETRLSDDRRGMILRIGKHNIRRDFERNCWLEAVLRDAEGSVIRKMSLSATRTTGGVNVDAATMNMPLTYGPLRLDIECGDSILESYQVSTVDCDEPWLMFTSSGTMIKEDPLDAANLWLLLPREARILPESIVELRESFDDEPPYDIAWLDLQECEEYRLTVQCGDISRDYAVRPELKTEEISLRGGDAVQGAFIKGHPVYMGALAHVSFLVEGERGGHVDGFARLEVAIETLDGQTRLREDLAESLGLILQDDGWLDLNLLTQLLDIPAEQDMKMSFAWRDASGIQRSVSLFRISGLIIDFDQKVLILQAGGTAGAQMIVPPGWEFAAGSGVEIAGGFDDVVELHLAMDSYATTYGRLVRDGLKLPIAIEPPVVAWRFLGAAQTRYRRFGGTTEDIWLADIDAGAYEVIDIMTTAPSVSSVRLEAGPAYGDLHCLAGGRGAVQLKLGQLAEAIRSQPPRTKLYVVVSFSDSSDAVRIHVATVHSEWVPESIEATMAGSGDHRRIELNWMGVPPRSRTLASVWPAWIGSGQRLESAIEPGARQCIFEANSLCPGPYCVVFLDEKDMLWGGSKDTSTGTLIWISDGGPQIRGFEAVREGAMLRCSGSAWPESVCDSLAGAVLRNRPDAGLETVEIAQFGNGRFEFAIYDGQNDASIVGVYSMVHESLYRFVAVGMHDGATETVTRSSAAKWLCLFDLTPGGLPMRIQECGVRAIAVAGASGNKILRGLAANLREIGFSIDDPHYPGPVKLIVSDSEDGFDFSFETSLGKCKNPNCPHPPGVISQSEWNDLHHPKCKTFDTHYKSVRARIMLAYDIDWLVGQVGKGGLESGPHSRVIADGCFRPFAGGTGELRDPIKLGEALLQSYVSRCRELLVECGTGEEADR
jgi:hypothetical protein